MIKIAYAGSLGGYDPKMPNRNDFFLYKWFWTFRNDIVNPATRSGYYLIQAVKILRERYKVSASDVKISWWGKIDSMNLAQVNAEGLSDYFEHAEYLPKMVSLNKMRRADLFLLPLEKAKKPDTRTLFIPGKLYEYLNMRKPILALCEPSDCKTILEESGLGIFAPPDKPEEIATVLWKIINGEIALGSYLPNDSFIEKYSFVHKTKELADVFNYCLSNVSGKPE